MIVEVPFYWVDKYPDRGGSSAVPVAQVLDKIFPVPGNADPAPPLFRELQDKLASAQKRARDGAGARRQKSRKKQKMPTQALWELLKGVFEGGAGTFRK